MKRFILILLIGLWSIPHVKSYNFEYEGIGYNIIGGDKVEVTSLTDGRKYSGTIYIPATIVLGEDSNTPLSLGTKESSKNQDNEDSGKGIVYNVVKIGDFAFKDCTDLIKLEMPTVIKEIGVQAIAGCANLTGISMPNALETINDEAFMGSCLKSISFNSRLSEIGNRAFYGASVDDIMMESCKLTAFGEETFANSTIKRIILPRGLKSIAQNTFKDCKNLVYVQLGESLEEIHTGAFAGCESLTSISLPSNLKIVDENAFYGTKISAISFNSNEAPEYNIKSICGEKIPTLITLPYEATNVYWDCCPQLLDGKVKIYFDSYYYNLYWAYTGTLNLDNPNRIIPEGVTTECDTPAFYVNKDENLFIAIPLLSGGGYKFFFDGNEMKPEQIFLPLDYFYLNNYPTSLLGSAFLLELKNVTEDTEINLVPDESDVDMISLPSNSINYQQSAKIISSEDNTINIYDFSGKLLMSGCKSLYIGGLAPGLYIVKNSKEAKKIILQ